MWWVGHEISGASWTGHHGIHRPVYPNPLIHMQNNWILDINKYCCFVVVVVVVVVIVIVVVIVVAAAVVLDHHVCADVQSCSVDPISDTEIIRRFEGHNVVESIVRSAAIELMSGWVGLGLGKGAMKGWVGGWVGLKELRIYARDGWVGLDIG